MEKNLSLSVSRSAEKLFDGGADGGKNPKFMPSKEEVYRVLEDIKKILFPKYFQPTVDFTLEKCKKQLSDAAERIKGQIELALQYEMSLNCGASCVCGGVSERAESITERFIESLPRVKELLLLDIRATLDGDPAATNVDLVLLTYTGIEAIFVYRVAHVLSELQTPLLPRIMTEYAHCKTGIDIHPAAKIGKRFCIDHGTGVVVGETAEIGDGVKLYQGVTLGAISLKDSRGLVGKKRHPTVKDNVTVYAGATILGGKTVIGEGATIGSSAFITESVDGGVTVAVKKPELMRYAVGSKITE